MHQDHDAPPFNPLPPVVIALAVVIFGIEVLFSLATKGIIGPPEAVGWRLAALRDYAFYPQILQWMLETGQAPPELLLRFITYPFIHVSFTQMLFVVVFILAIGKAVGEVLPFWAVLVIFFGAAISGALAYGLLVAEGPPLAGGFPAVYGLIGAFTYLLMNRLAAVGANRYRAFTLIGFLLLIQLVFAILFGSSKDWIADIAGFGAGFALTILLAPGGWRHFLQIVRRR